MTEAAAAWDRLAARLYAAAGGLPVGDLKAGDGLAGRGERAYIDWLDATAAQAEHAATQAAAAANAYRVGVGGGGAPAGDRANRAQRTSLASTNCLGQPGPAIADTEAEYEQMWARDAAAMNAYAGASADAAPVTPFASPPADQRAAARTWALTAAPEVDIGRPPGDLSDSRSAAGAFLVTADNVRCVPFAGDVVAVETEFTVRAVGLRDRRT